MTINYNDVYTFAQELSQSEIYSDGETPEDLIQSAQHSLTRPCMEPIDQSSPDYWSTVHEYLDINASYYYS